MAKIYNNILETVGNTPLVKINKINTGKAQIIAKVEYFNPGGSVKDRVGIAMIENAERAGLLKSGGLIIEPTSGNTGIGLALAAAVKNYKLILTMPDTMSIERRKLLQSYGAEIILTPGNEGMQGAINKAEELHQQYPNSIIPQQFENPSNPAIHYSTTAEELWRDSDGQIDAFVAGVGTGGTISGVAKFLKEKNPSIKIFAIEPDTSRVLSGGEASPHKLQGIGANFVPKIYRDDLIDEIIAVSAEDAGKTALAAAQKEALLIGISGGAALFAALELSKKSEWQDKNIVVLLPDNGERYLSTWLFNDLK
jgi:cysteine synthase A